MVESKDRYEGEIESLIIKGRGEIEGILEIAEMGFFAQGERYGFEQITGVKMWEEMSENSRVEFLKGMGEVLGVDLVNIKDEQVLRREYQEGARGELTKEGAEVTVLQTRHDDFEVHVADYKNPDLGTRYDFVKKE